VAALTNVTRAIAYACSEMGEAATFSADQTTVSTKLAKNGAVVLAPGTTIAQAETHVIAVHPQIGAIKG
jgi:N-methylhydantoinase B/oxoprolinase/acetone carboxylase alpha subunit